MSSESDVLRQVRDELAHDAVLSQEDIDVRVAAGLVTLSGAVASLPKRIAAARLAARVAGIYVLNELVVRLPIDHHRRDVDVAHDATVALIDDVDLREKGLQVRVRDGWLWLLGTVDREEFTRRAEGAILNVSGVRGVTNLVRLRSSSRPDEARQSAHRHHRRDHVSPTGSPK